MTALLVLALGGTAPSAWAVSSGSLSGAAVASSDPATEADSALAEAATSGERVEVVGERTERETTFANPDGATFTLEKSIAPVRVKQPGGEWVKPDATLVQRADGSIGPKAAVAGVTFSAGGSGTDLVKIAEGRRSVALGWAGELPVPTLDGPRATYANVLPGVNLIMTATVVGYRQVLEVRTAEAAANPALKQIKFAMKADGLRVKGGPGGGVEAVDPNGQVVFRSPVAQMWNSAGDTAEPTQMRALAASAAPADVVQVAPGEEGDPLAGPGAGDESAVLDIDLTATSVTVTPDAGLLAKADAASLPLYIDPTVELNEDERTVLSSDGDVFYNFSGGDNGMSVGKCGSAVIGGVSYYCGSGYVNRMYFEFSPTKLAGKEILDATFNVTETWSFSCDSRWVDLERTNNISASTKWPGPAKLDQMGDRDISAGRGTACSPSQPRAAIRFHDNAEEPDENLTPTVKAFAAGKMSRLTLMLMAKDESDTVSWKRFDDDAVLSVVFVAKPALPEATGLVVGSSPVCSPDSTKPTIVSDPTPAVTGKPKVVAGGETGARLRIRWRTEKLNGTAWEVAHTDVTSPTSGFVGNAVKQTQSLPALSEGVSYRLKALTLSYQDNGTSFLNTGYTTPCYFQVDATAPKAPTIGFNGPYTLCTTTDCAQHGKPGLPGSFTFGPYAGDVNKAYRYALSTGSNPDANPQYIYPPAGSPVTVTDVTPMDSGTIHLRVEAQDAAGTGRWGAPNIVDFLVKESDAPVGRWSFNEASGDAKDTSTTDPALQDNATLATGATRTDMGRRGEVSGASDLGLKTDGATGYAATAGQVIDTRSSYTLAAWVRMDPTTHNATVLGQNGVNRSPFLLGYEQALGKWSFKAVNTDAPKSGTWSYQQVASKNPAVPGVWTHLTGVYDATAKKLSLYVNGKPQGSVAYTTAWAATGAFQIGRVQWSEAFSDYFPGIIDEVAVWQEAKTEADVAKEAATYDVNTGLAYPELVTDWDAAGATGTTLANQSPGYGHDLALSSGASLDGEAIVLNGSTGAGTTTGPLVDDSGSFTVSTHVALDTAKLVNKPIGYQAQILGQRTTTGSSWSIWFELTGTDMIPDEDTGELQTVVLGQWHFGRLTADGTGTSVVSDTVTLGDGEEVSPTGIYDAQAGTTGTISLYLDADQKGIPLVYTAAIGSGEFAVGKGYLNSVWGNYLPGRITRVRVWAGALSNSDQVTAVVGI
ncbi:LamG domain-containing protein [Streptomyces sp. NBC_01520]|uniref:LamG domain-containing protein n=1 Tax=Streptomyces sp. NBC_01520 TaxID=2903892 RepID=UPI00386D241A